MIFDLLILLAVVCMILIPIAKKQRDRALVERLKQIRKTHNPTEALIAVDNAIQTNRQEGNFVEKTRWIWFWFR